MIFIDRHRKIGYNNIRYAGLAHLVERLLPKQKVAGSSPVTRSKSIKSGPVPLWGLARIFYIPPPPCAFSPAALYWYYPYKSDCPSRYLGAENAAEPV